MKVKHLIQMLESYPEYEVVLSPTITSDIVYPIISMYSEILFIPENEFIGKMLCLEDESFCERNKKKYKKAIVLYSTEGGRKGSNNV